MKLIEALKTRWVLWVWNHTPTCAEMARLASQSLDEPPSLAVRLRMRLHYRICVWCERYLRHLKFLRRTARRFEVELEAVSHRALSPEARQRMLRRLHEEWE